MHYFQFNIGDYASHTSRLTPLEDLAYRRMLDLYYLNEQPLNECVKEVAREIGLSEYASEVEYVLCKFFTKNENGFSQKRIDLEIKKYKSNAKNKSRAGKASAKARAVKASKEVTGVEQVLNTTSTDVEQNTKHKPLTINQEPLTSLVIKDKVAKAPIKRFVAPSVEDVYQYCTERCNNVDAQNFVDHYIANGWMRGKAKVKDWKACVRTWEKNSNSNTQGAKQFSDVTAQNIKNLEGGW
jgi:uncharacterized protein YdaU (DUF1376 family)